ncbi:hypothetical protein DEU56DRAFT_792636 [Suillus clintonianus]|uniref:uncharacterized protein n=1 Tax=Suillus clintonianus TaxID=1904413 RepID=UPI001B883A42|nr:uncharacterized protein DEU56DRAFT_792636 [Suillus clintonianus]KAG2142948.1 hypothetical protein DEU56DRAFT_792636 [Suillus clintonianus]
MEPITQFPFTDLPVELALIILRYSAIPSFDQDNLYDARNPYSFALALCCVSRVVRRAVLPELLHTILLQDARNVRLFVHALRMQKTYAETKNHLHFDYAPHVHKMWIVSQGGNHAPARFLTTPRAYATKPSESGLDVSLLAPILLAAPSLALSWTSMDLLAECLEHAWTSRAATHVNDENSPPPWNTQTLTLSCTPPTTGPWWERLTNTPQGSAFLASISHLSTNTSASDYKSYTSSDDHRLPLWMEITPWASFKSLKTVLLPYPRHINPPADQWALIFAGIDSHVELLTLSAALLRDRRDSIPKEIEALAEIGPGEECIRSSDIRLKVSRSCIRWYNRDGWEKVWACML